MTAVAKAALRQAVRHQRRSLPIRERRAAAQALIAGFRKRRELFTARRVAAYWPVGSEADTRPLLAWLLRRGVEVYLPRIVAGADSLLRFQRLDPTALRRSLSGGTDSRPVLRSPRAVIKSSRCTQRLLRRMDLILIPLLAFDATGTRLGQGGGYYDRALARLSAHRPLRVGVAYALQERSALPRDAWDVPLHGVLTERGLRRFRGVRSAGSTTGADD